MRAEENNVCRFGLDDIIPLPAASVAKDHSEKQDEEHYANRWQQLTLRICIV
ncbi:hypothetical protein [Chryseolinea lacunae]|uniref:Uncharacterized protein n=1 Tax=Chryseolinea lacunae TaxID=2801331 RepID=A0ABS1KV01_9BACT|nr:hypothetical protein [Chryseolinea lacunae]MBL0743165.1 hypothetical protein [Chryseolinea lacunae]